MGIKNLMKIINRYAEKSVKSINISDLKNKTLAIDANLMIYKSVYAIRRKLGDDLKTKEGKKVTHIYSMFLKLYALRKYNITAIFVFDGKYHQFKQKVMDKRNDIQKEVKEKYRKSVTEEEKKKYYYVAEDITTIELKEIKELIKAFGFNYINSIEEADSQCAKLARDGIVDAVISDDMDILLFGAKYLIKNFTIDKKKEMQIIDLNKVLKLLKIKMNQLIELGILLGSDYLETITGIGAIKSYKMILMYGSISKIIKNNIISKKYNYKAIVKYFEHPKALKKYTLTKSDLNKNVLTKLLDIYGLTNSKTIMKYIDNL